VSYKGLANQHGCALHADAAKAGELLDHLAGPVRSIGRCNLIPFTLELCNLRKYELQPRKRSIFASAFAGIGSSRPVRSSASPAPGFKQGGASPLRLGHVAIISADGDKLIAFFKDFLGFWFTDDILGIANFLTCNREHHVVNIVKAPQFRVHHIAFELRDNACHALAADALRGNGVPLLWGPSRHGAGHNLASYHHDPDKVMVEFYTEMDAFIPELGMCEPRPWHEHYPMKPRSWAINELNAWGAEFGFNLAAG
jgi:catechol 2,3-dioxygenase-like lactoylglutathione lyase family enzyme